MPFVEALSDEYPEVVDKPTSSRRKGAPQLTAALIRDLEERPATIDDVEDERRYRETMRRILNGG